VSVTQGLAGTPGYTAPEVATRGRRTAQSEVYSGVVLLELLLGQRAGLNTAADAEKATRKGGGVASLATLVQRRMARARRRRARAAGAGVRGAR
jgi:hypothetical protein